MNEPDNFALVPRPSSAVEKAAPGAKRILSCMVADTLALVKKELQSKREVHVLMAGAPEFYDCFSLIVSIADELLKAHYHFHFHSCQRMEELTGALKQRKFDLALVQLHSHPPAEHKFTDNREVLLRLETLIAENQYIVWAGLETACFLHTVHGIPVVILSDTGQEEAERLLAAQVGARALFPWLEMDIRAFCKFLRGILLQIPSTPRNSRPLRIVMVDDDPDLLEVYVEIVRGWFNQIEVVAFDKPLKALEELEQRDPDLLITGDRMPHMGGEQLVQRLITRNIKYPILVLTANTQAQQWVDDYARRGFNIGYQEKPGSEQEQEGLRSFIEKALHISLPDSEKSEIAHDKIERPVGTAPPPRVKRPPRIVVMDDEPFVGDSMKMLIEFWWSNAKVLTFTDAEEAMQELLREDPDLFTTDWNHTKIPCEDMLGLLADRKVKYPVLVISGSAERLLEMRISDEFRNQGLDVKLLAKPITADQLRGELLKHFGPGNPSTQFPEK